MTDSNINKLKDLINNHFKDINHLHDLLSKRKKNTLNPNASEYTPLQNFNKPNEDQQEQYIDNKEFHQELDEEFLQELYEKFDAKLDEELDILNKYIDEENKKNKKKKYSKKNNEEIENNENNIFFLNNMFLSSKLPINEYNKRKKRFMDFMIDFKKSNDKNGVFRAFSKAIDFIHYQYEEKEQLQQKLDDEELQLQQKIDINELQLLLDLYHKFNKLNIPNKDSLWTVFNADYALGNIIERKKILEEFKLANYIE